MIISHKYKFIFIKTSKTAGTSLEIFLSQLCGEKDIVTPIYPHVEPHQARNYQSYWNPLPEIIKNKGRAIEGTIKALCKKERFYNHMPAELVKQRVPSHIWNSYFKFCVDRNPWDKTLSHYHMVNDRSGGSISFEDYLEQGNFCLNMPMYTDSKGKLLVDRVLKYESLMEELDSVFQDLNIPFTGSLGVRAKSEHRKDRRPYTDILSNEQRLFLENVFAKEIEINNYSY